MRTLVRIAIALEKIAAELHLMNIPAIKDKPAKGEKTTRKHTYAGRRDWTPKDDATLREMRYKGCNYNKIGAWLNRTPSACSARYWQLTHGRAK